MAKKRECIICGTKYKYCRNCSQYDPEETWRNLFCSENCKDIFNIASEHFDSKNTNVQEAYEKLSEKDLSKKSQFNKHILAEIEKILSDGQSKISVEKTEESEDKDEVKKPVVKSSPVRKKETAKAVVKTATATEKIVND